MTGETHRKIWLVWLKLLACAELTEIVLRSRHCDFLEGLFSDSLLSFIICCNESKLAGRKTSQDFLVGLGTWTSCLS